MFIYNFFALNRRNLSMESSPSLNLSKTPLLSQKIRTKDAEPWNSIIRFHTKLKNDQAIIKSYNQMKVLGISPDSFALPLILKACARLQAVELGKKIHSYILSTPLFEDVRIRTALVDFYCKCGFVSEARQVFDETTHRDLVLWNAMICGYVGVFLYKDSIALFFWMWRENLKPNSVTLVGLLSACAGMLALKLGQEIHCYVLRNGFLDSDVHVGTSLLGFYSRFDLRISRFVFDSMAQRNTITWNAMASGYFNVGDVSGALNLFIKMLVAGVELNFVTLLVIVQSCSDFGSLELGKQVHQLAIKFRFSSDIYVENALIDMYAKNGSFESSTEIFEKMPTKDVASWNAIIFACKICGDYRKALNLYNRMRSEEVKEDMVTVATMLTIFAQYSCLEAGKTFHAYIIKSGMEIDGSVGNALLCMYGDFDSVESARRIFSKMRELDIVSWNNLILALIRNKLTGEAWDLFSQMQQTGIKPNSFTMVAVLAACEGESFKNIGRSIHGYIIRRSIELNTPLCTALVDMYMNCGDESIARLLFESFSDRDLISWNAIIANYVQNDRPNEALLLFHRMGTEVKPNSVTMINILPSCARMADLPQGRCIHAYIIRRELTLTSDVSMENALLTMYAKCGNIRNAEKIFERLPKKDIISWNAMIAGYGMHGCGEDALLVFSQMKEAGLVPTSVTFVSVLSACSHSGLVEKGMQHFHSMTRDYNIKPEVVHYACIVDLLSRAGRLDEARNFISLMPIEPDASVWRALLGSCRLYSNIKLARTVSEKLIELEPLNIGNYILLSNIYAAAGSWDDVKRLRTWVKEKALRKTPGISQIVIRAQAHSFTVGDRSHPETDRIYKKLSCLTSKVIENGYVPDSSWVLHDVEDEEKDQRLFSHSEKLAIAFGLLNSSDGVPILITKNLRVCGDCHTFIKSVSKFIRREIVLRDATRFHHFVDGVCSCKDYW